MTEEEKAIESAKKYACKGCIKKCEQLDLLCGGARYYMNAFMDGYDQAKADCLIERREEENKHLRSIVDMAEEPRKAITLEGANLTSSNVKVGDRFYIEELTVKATGSFEEINLENVPVIAVDVRKDGVLFNFENILFRHCIDEDYVKSGDFEETELGGYLKNAFRNALVKAIGVDVKDCSLLTKEQVFEDLEYFKSRKNRIKVLNDDSDIWWWWLKSPYASNSTAFCYVFSDGYSYYYDASLSTGGVAPAFLITRD